MVHVDIDETDLPNERPPSQIVDNGSLERINVYALSRETHSTIEDDEELRTCENTRIVDSCVLLQCRPKIKHYYYCCNVRAPASTE